MPNCVNFGNRVQKKGVYNKLTIQENVSNVNKDARAVLALFLCNKKLA